MDGRLGNLKPSCAEKRLIYSSKAGKACQEFQLAPRHESLIMLIYRFFLQPSKVKGFFGISKFEGIFSIACEAG